MVDNEEKNKDYSIQTVTKREQGRQNNVKSKTLTRNNEGY